MFYADGYVKQELWNGMVELLKIFLSAYTNAFSIMEANARQDTGDMDIFNHTHATVASRLQLTAWITTAWETVSELTECRRIAQVMTSMKTATLSNSSAAIYNEAITRVSALLGKVYKVVSPVSCYDPR